MNPFTLTPAQQARKNYLVGSTLASEPDWVKNTVIGGGVGDLAAGKAAAIDLGPEIRGLMSRVIKTGKALPSEIAEWVGHVRSGWVKPEFLKQTLEARLGIRQYKIAQLAQKAHAAGIPPEVVANLSHETKWFRMTPEQMDQAIGKMMARKTPPAPAFAPEEAAKTAQRFHGSQSPIKELMDYSYSPANIYGQGFYTTDNVDVARGYAGSKAGRGVYPVLEKGAQKLVDLDKPPPKEALEYIEKQNVGVGAELNDFFKHNPKASLREWYDQLHDFADGVPYSANDVQETFDGLAQHLESKGYTGLTHEGGWNTGGEKHQVNIYFNPKKSIQLGKAFLGLGGAVGLFGLGTFGKPSQAEAAEDPSGAVRPVMADNNALEINQNPNAQKLRAIMADPRWQRITDAQRSQIINSLSTGKPIQLAQAKVSTPTTMGGATARGKMSPAEAAQLAQLQSTVEQLQALRKQFQQIDPDTWNRSGGTSRVIGGVQTAGAPHRLWQKFARAHGMSLADSSDPKIQQLNTLIGNAITQHAQATAALMKSAGTRNYQFANEAQGHLPDAAADYQTNMTNLNNLLAPDGPYARMIDNLKNGTGSLPMDTTNLNMKGTPAPMGMATPMATPTADPVAAALAKHGVTP